MAKALELIRALAGDLIGARVDDDTLAEGSAGVALFFAYLAEFQPYGPWRAAADRLLTCAASAPVSSDARYSFMHGLTGIGWTSEHLSAQFSIRPAMVSADALDAEILTRVGQRPWSGVYDHADGLAGLGLYAIERLHSPSARPILERVIDRLAETAVHLPNGISWWTPPQTLSGSRRQAYPSGGFNLGLAHGIPSILVFLSLACHLGIATLRARSLLNCAMNWLLAQRNPAGAWSRFNSFVSLSASTRSPEPALVRWCYGDLGVSAAIYWSAVLVDNTDWARDALALAREVAERPVTSTRPSARTACLCHGSAGNGHLFNRLYQATQDEAFQLAACRWFDHTLSLDRPVPDIKMVQMTGETDENTKATWTQSHGLFGGSAGIALALLGAVSDITPDWDRVMMVAMPPS